MKLMKVFVKKYQILFLIIFSVATLIAQNDDPLVKSYNLYVNKQYKESFEICKSLVDNDRNYTAAVFLLGRIYFALGDIDSAKVYIERAIDLDKHNSEFRDFANSIQNFNNMLRDATRAFTVADYEEAKSLYEKVIEENPNFADAYYSLAMTNIRLNDVSAAANNFRRAIELNPVEERYQKGFEELVNRFLSEGNQLYRRRDYIGAKEKITQAINLKPDEFMAYYLLSIVKLAEKDFSGALESVKKCVGLNNEYSKAFLVQGKIYQGLNNSVEALNSYRKAVKIDPKYYDAWMNIGNLYLQKGDNKESITAYKKAVAINPESSKAYSNLGAIHIKMEKYYDAIGFLEKAVELDNKSRTSWLRLAQGYNKTGKCSEAKEAAQKALKLKVNWAPANFELGTAERCLGNLSAAKQAFQMAKKDPAWRKAAQYELDRMK